MDVSLNRSSLIFIKKMVDEYPAYGSGFHSQREIENKIEMCVGNTRAIVNLTKLKLETINDLISYLKESNVDNDALFLINSYFAAIKNPDSAIVKSIKAFPSIFSSWLLKNHIHGWLFQQEADGTCVPWLVDEIKFHPKFKDSPASVSVKMKCNSAGADKGIGSKSINVEFKDVYNKRVEEILIEESLVKETPELIAQYEKDVILFKQYISMHGKQFVPNKQFISVDVDDSASYRSKNVINIDANEKFINDDRNAKRVVVEEYKSYFWKSVFDNTMYQAMVGDDEADVLSVKMIITKAGKHENVNFDRLPIHLRVRMFNLSGHTSRMIHVSKIKPYEYKSDIENKLILPQDHHDLIKMLTEEVGDFNLDVIDGKNLGCNILCVGKPGLGKTLTAEIYSEVCQKPLYRVHSGQLGSDAVAIEKNLEVIMSRSSDWGAILLIDEADVFIRSRDNDMAHNAIVSVFLRKMEYYKGLLFMTSNRDKDIDDAILSRCIAVIKYSTPGDDELFNIWSVQNKQMQAGMNDELIKELTKTYNGLSGRDVNRLLALTKRYAENKGIALDGECFRKCAVFRGVI